MVEEALRLQDLPAPDGEYPTHRGVDLDSALTSAGLNAPESKDAIPDVAKLAPLVSSIAASKSPQASAS